MDPPVIISEHAEPHSSLVPVLRANLPYALPLLRRIQHARSYPSSTEAFLATFPPGNTNPSLYYSSSPWLAAYVDLFSGRQTQIWIFSSLEAKAGSEPYYSSSDILSSFVPDSGAISEETWSQARHQLLALLSYVKSNLLPIYLASVEAAVATEEYVADELETTANPLNPPKIPAPPPNAFVIGTMHTALFSLLTVSGTYSDPVAVPGIRIYRYENPPYIKYLFHPMADGTPSKACQGEFNPVDTNDGILPSRYRYYDQKGRYGVLPQHLDLVISRTYIPRSREVLLMMPSTAIYHYDNDDNSSINGTQIEPGQPSGGEEIPIAWGFLSVDGSVASLYVEPEHRGRGLAAQLCKEVIRTGLAPGSVFRPIGEGQGQGPAEETEAVAHADVLMTNIASRRVMEKAGGEVAWTNTWAVVELNDKP